jgi:hypothetical protein
VEVVIWRGASTIQVTNSGAKKLFIVDPGSSFSLLQPGVSPNRIRAASVTPIGVTGDELEVTGLQEAFFCNNRSYTHQFCVCFLPTEADGIIGMGFLALVNARLDLEKQELWMLKYRNPDSGPGEWRAWGASGKAKCVALTVFSTSNGDQSRHERQSKFRIGNDMSRKEGSEHPHIV